MNLPESNKEALEDFWYWINERYLIYLKKESGQPKPWTEDPILQNWKFCNVFRILDKQSQWLLANVIKSHSSEHTNASLLLFNIFVFRAFNLHETYDYITTHWTGNDYIYSWNKERIMDILNSYISEENTQLTSGAYMLRGREGMPKYKSITMSLDEIWLHKENLFHSIMEERTLEHAYQEIVEAKYWGWGPFTSYQIVLDLTYTPILGFAPDMNTWCCFGPGAIKGIREIWPGLQTDKMIDASKVLLETHYEKRQPHLPELTLQDIEFSLCELSKYRRIKAGGRAKEKYNGARI